MNNALTNSAISSPSQEALLVQLRDELAQIVARKTVTGSQASIDMIDELAQEFDELGLHVTRFEQNGFHSVAATTRPTKQPKILFNAHLDVAPGAEELFTLRQENDRLYGRGVYDMKFSIACYLHFLRIHKDILPQLDLGIMITSDEETGGADGAGAMTQAGWGAKLAIVPDGAREWAVERRAKGFQRFLLKARGATAHGGRPWEGKSALEPLLDALQDIRALSSNTDPDGLTYNIGIIQSGEAVNQVPATATAKVEIRSFSNDEMDKITKRIEEIVAIHDIEIDHYTGGPALQLRQDDPLVQKFCDHVEAVTGQPLKLVDSFAASDALRFEAVGTPTVVLWPNGGGAHSNDEWLEAASLPKFYKLIENFTLETARV